MMAENLSLKKTIKVLKKTQLEKEQNNETLKQSMESLRVLAAALMKDAQSSKKVDMQKEKLFHELALDNVLLESEPPIE